MVAAVDSLIGEAVGGSYVISQRLGEGGMGVVYLASSKMLAGKPAAVKVLLRECSDDPEAMSRFRAEVFAAGKIHDPNIVKVFDAGHLPDGRMYMLMEYCSGGSLEELLARKGALPLEEIVNLLGPVASVLDEAHHDAKITHRDIKPANILLVHEAGSPLRSRLGDFGIAKLHFDKLDTRAGTRNLLGSPGYMAPEQCDLTRGSGDVDHRADVYALASVLYQMTTGQRPYTGTSLYQLIENVANNRPIPRPRTLRPDLPKACDDAIMDGLAHNRDARIQTVKELALRFAAGVPNGESLLAFVAPRLVRSRLAPTDKTISGDIGAAAMQWSHAHAADTAAARSKRKRQGLAVALGVVCSLGLGVVAGRLSSSSNHAATRHADVVAVAPVLRPVTVPVLDVPGTPMPATQVAAAVAPAIVAAAPVAAAPGSVEVSVLSDASVAQAVDARPVAAPVAAPVTAPVTAAVASAVAVAVPAAKPVAAAPVVKVRPPAVKPAVAKTVGTLLVRVEPFAEVSIDGVYQGPAPVQTQLSIGRHEVTLVGPAKHREIVEIKIVAGKKVVVERNW
ncbi:MAG: serine/threonine protein kinase [Kofleriaceae bacterium]|nr:serine/threonine protein kinase [Kofleriaceae bacterium]